MTLCYNDESVYPDAIVIEEDFENDFEVLEKGRKLYLT